MKKKRIIGILLLIAYCIPFAFLCVCGDGIYGTMLFYGIMVAAFGLLCRVSLKATGSALPFIGSILSFASSCAAAGLYGLEPMGHYFKPFTSHSLIVTISVIVIILHMVILLIYAAKHKRPDGN